MTKTYATLLSTDDYLDGALALHHSLQATSPKHPFVVFVTPDISDGVLRELSRRGIGCEEIEPWPEPTRWLNATEDDPYPEREQRWRFNYSKLSLFGLERYSKIVFLDSDLLVLGNVDELFEAPHMSAVNAGGRLPELAAWREPNSGVLVIEPSLDLKVAMLDMFDGVEFRQGGDQELIHAFYPSWPEQHELHLDHRFNLFHTHLDRYNELFGYSLGDDEPTVRIVHFYAAPKPWEQVEAIRSMATAARRTRRWAALDRLRRRATAHRRIADCSDLRPLAVEALVRWLSVFDEVTLGTAPPLESSPDAGQSIPSSRREHVQSE